MIVGYDISTAQQVEDSGRSFADSDGPRALESILARHGATHIRLRLWVDPPYPFSDLEHVLGMARRVRDAGLKLLLCFHYCDFWADPAKQPTPARWAEQDVNTLAGTLYEYTISVLRALADHETPASMVQIGNEITNGMLWPQEKIYEDGQERWDGFVALLNAGIAAARDGIAAGHAESTMIHIDRGADNEGSRYFFDHIFERGAEFDVIGLSFYPWWHGTIAQLRNNLHDLSLRYQKPLIVVETAYLWTLENHDSVPNGVSSDTELPKEYPATVDGQHAFLRRLRSEVEQVPSGRGAGIMYWEPAWLPGVGWSPETGNGWDNLTLFDPQGHALPSLDWSE